MNRVFRVDWSGPIVVVRGDVAPPPGAIAARETPEGYLRIEGRLNGCGVYQYENEAGESWGELRLPEHVGAPATLESWQLRPLTDDHPSEMVDASNVAEYRRGVIGERVTFDGEHTIASLLIDSPELIAKVRAGKTQLSCGYTMVPVEQAGSHNGIAYRVLQTEIYGNHAAVVDLARGGPTCSLIFDGAARRRPNQPTQGGHTVAKPKKKDAATLVTSEGSIEIPDSMLPQIQAMIAKGGEQPSNETKVEVEGDAEAPPVSDPAVSEEPKSDALEAKLDLLAAENKRLRDGFGPAVTARVSLVSKAREILGSSTKLDGLNDNAIKRAVVIAITPSMADKLDGRSSEYIDAAYEMALNTHADRNDSSAELLRRTGRAIATDSGSGSIQASYEQMLNNRRDGVEMETN